MRTLLLLLSPFAPHMCEELWESMGFAGEAGRMICQMAWPAYDESKTIASTVEMAVQVQGKLRGAVSVPVDSEESAVVEAAKAVEKVARALEGMEIDMDAEFDFKGKILFRGHKLLPPAHPRCACAIEYIEETPYSGRK